MKAVTFVKVGAGLAFVTALLFWQDVWGWVNSKPPMDIALDIVGFALKWFYLALFGFLAVTIPHYVMPWLQLFRRQGRMRLRQARQYGKSAGQRSNVVILDDDMDIRI